MQRKKGLEVSVTSEKRLETLVRDRGEGSNGFGSLAEGGRGGLAGSSGVWESGSLGERQSGQKLEA